jgi:F0F1-type ATP synthase membrane subunit a
MATTQTTTEYTATTTLLEESEVHASEEHSGPHIPLIQGETVYGPITNITLTIIIFLGMVSLFAFFAKRALTSAKKSKLRTGVLTYVQFADRYLRDTFGDKKSARTVFPLIVGMFTIIFFGNLFGLLIDWVGMSISGSIFAYLRPMHSDLNTTLVLATVVVVTMLKIQIQSQ